MAIYSVAVRTQIANTANAGATLLTGSTIRAVVFEAGWTLATANATVIGFGHPGAGTTPATNSAGQPEDMAGPTSTVNVAVTWTTYPTAPANFFRRASFPNTVGAGIIWTFPRGVTVPTSNSICFYNINTLGANSDCWLVWDE